jgi:hypothetical protein
MYAELIVALVVRLSRVEMPGCLYSLKATLGCESANVLFVAYLRLTLYVVTMCILCLQPIDSEKHERCASPPCGLIDHGARH